MEETCAIESAPGKKLVGRIVREKSPEARSQLYELQKTWNYD